MYQGLSGVTVKAAGIQTATWTNGIYKLGRIVTGIQTLTASKTHYTSDNQPVLVTGN